MVSSRMISSADWRTSWNRPTSGDEDSLLPCLAAAALRPEGTINAAASRTTTTRPRMLQATIRGTITGPFLKQFLDRLDAVIDQRDRPALGPGEFAVRIEAEGPVQRRRYLSGGHGP